MNDDDKEHKKKVAEVENWLILIALALIIIGFLSLAFISGGIKSLLTGIVVLGFLIILSLRL